MKGKNLWSGVRPQNNQNVMGLLPLRLKQERDVCDPGQNKLI
jgi:hypothetical protein